MKKLLITLVAILTLLCGCQANENTNTSDYGDDISKAQEIAVISPDTAEVIDTITDTEEIKNFVYLVENGKLHKRYIVSNYKQEKTYLVNQGLEEGQTLAIVSK